mgnify:CR=1 FL=1|tara:strand:+ start:612 stop:875 length:264 start_codon:yes stop_codon:yes gene_type:complete
MANCREESGWLEVTSVMLEQAGVWSNAGPVRTQHDMSEEEIKQIEKRYGVPVMLNVEIEVREPIETYVHDSWHKIRQREKARRKCAA